MSEIMRNVLVKCGDSQKPLKLHPPWKRTSLITMVQDKFGLPPVMPLLLQIYDTDWETYIDLEDDLEIPDRSKINIIVKPNVYNESHMHSFAIQKMNNKIPQSENFGNYLVHGTTEQSSLQLKNNLLKDKTNEMGMDKNIYFSPGTTCTNSLIMETSLRLPQSGDIQSTGHGEVTNSKGPNQTPCRTPIKVQPQETPEGNSCTSTEVEVSDSVGFDSNNSSSNVQEKLSMDVEEDNNVLDSEEDEDEDEDCDVDNFSDDAENVPDVHFQAPWPHPYQLPDDTFPKKLLKVLEKQEPIDWSLKHILMQGLADSILQYTAYPTREQRDEVIVALLDRFPYLARNRAKSFTRWRSMLNDKFKNIRRKMRSPDNYQRQRSSDMNQSVSNVNIASNALVDIASKQPVNSFSLSLDNDESYNAFNQPGSHVNPGTIQNIPSMMNTSPGLNPLSSSSLNPNPVLFNQHDSAAYKCFTSILGQETRTKEQIFLEARQSMKKSKAWPKPYILPKETFPLHLKRALFNQQKLDGPKANMLTRCLSDSVQSYTIFPTIQQREEIVQCLIDEYPYLRDNSPTGYAYYYSKLSDRFKFLRRKISRQSRENETDHDFVNDSADEYPPVSVYNDTDQMMDANDIKIEINDAS